ncbi:MAG: recombinase family protein, partial [Cellvibrionaceae bacterium]|nr:recombinase family protein [Cellvibrionaceae bacterium]
QLDKLEQAQCAKVFSEKRSGTGVKAREQLKACLEYLREGDVLIICKLDRLARNVRDLQNIADKLSREGIGLKVLDQDIDTTTPTGRLMFNMLGVIAEFENDLRRERQLDGIRKAKDKGVKFGAPRRLSEGQLAELRAKAQDSATPKAQLAKDYGISRASLYRYLNEETTAL